MPVGHVSHIEAVDAAVNPERKLCNVETTQGVCRMHPSSVNRHLEANGFLVYHEKVGGLTLRPTASSCTMKR